MGNSGADGEVVGGSNGMWNGLCLILCCSSRASDGSGLGSGKGQVQSKGGCC